MERSFYKKQQHKEKLKKIEYKHVINFIFNFV